MTEAPAVLYLSYDGMTDPLGQSQVLPYLEGLSRAGYRITLVSFEKPAAYAKDAQLIEARCSTSGIRWTPLSYTKKPLIVSTLYDLFRLRRLVSKLFQETSFSVLHCRSYLTTLVAMNPAHRRGAKVLFDMRGLWVDERVDGNIWQLNNPVFALIYKFLKRKEKWMLNRADAIVSLTHQAVPELKRLSADPALTVDVIPCCADIDHFTLTEAIKADSRERRKELQLPDSAFVLMYLGAIGTWYLLDEMLDFFVRLLVKKPDAYFLFITREDPAHVYQRAREKGIPADRIILRPAQRAEVPAWIATGDASIFFIRPSYSKQASSPTKQGEIMSMGIPIVCNAGVGDTRQIVEEGHAGVVLNSFTNEAYDHAIDQLLKGEGIAEAAAIRKAAITRFSLEEGVAAYARIYRRLIQA